MINRRNFLKNFGAAGAVLTVPAGFATAAVMKQPGKKDLENLTIKGQVHDNGKPIPGVAVTDGFNITTTDKKGNYELLSNNTAEFVYISVPSGYAIPHEKKIA